MDHTPPHSREAEMAVLGSMILNPSCVQEVRRIVDKDSYYIIAHSLIHQAILELPSVDLVTVKDELVNRGQLDKTGGIDYLVSLVETVPTAANAVHYANIIRKFHFQRKLVGLFSTAVKKVETGADLNGEMPEIIDTLRASTTQEFPKAEAAIDLLNATIAPLEYIIEPLAARGRLTLLQGEPKGGKSCVALLSAIAGSLGIWPCGRWASSGRPHNTIFLTYEDDRKLIQERISQYLLGMAEPFKQLLPTHLFVYCDENAPRLLLETTEGVSTLRKIIEEHQAEFLVIDTFSHITAADENLKKEMQPVMNALNTIARELNCSILLIHHTGKPSKDNSGKSMVYRSRGSSAIPAGFHAILDWGENAQNITQCKFVDKRGNKDKFAVEYLPEADDTIVRWKLVDSEEDGTSKYASRKSIIEAISKLILKFPEGVGRTQISKETKLAKNTIIFHLEALKEETSIQARQITSENGKKWVYAPSTYEWPKSLPNS